MPRYFVIRQETDEPQIQSSLYQEVLQGRLRQGWGDPGLDLRQDPERWRENYMKGDEQLAEQARERYRILLPMREIEAGDRLVVLKQPEHERFLLMIAAATDGQVYWFDADSRPGGDLPGDDFRHVVRIDQASIRSFHYRENIHTLVLHRKRSAYRSAVSNAWDQDFQQAVEALLGGEAGGAGPTPLAPAAPPPPVWAIVRADTIQAIIMDVLGRLRRIASNDLEKIIASMFEKQGFKILQTNRYNRTGGDFDLVLELDGEVHPVLEALSPDIGLDIILNVQVKQKDGIDRNDIQGVKQLVAMRPSKSVKEYAREWLILISTADSFTDECQALAKQEGVILIDGKAFAELYLRFS